MSTESRQQLSDTNAGSRHRALLLSGLPVTERRLQVAGVSTAVLGAGPPILLLHGPDFAGMWMRVIPNLVTTHQSSPPTFACGSPRTPAPVTDGASRDRELCG